MDAKTKHIVIAIDDSPPSAWAVAVGTELASRLDAVPVLLHVIVPPTLGVSEAALITDDLIERMRSDGEAVVAAARRRVPPGMPVRTELREGAPAQEIVAMARKVAADYIVIGSRGRGRWAHFILGSIAEAVIRGAPCPVVSVSHDPAKAAIRPEEIGGRTGQQPTAIQ